MAAPIKLMCVHGLGDHRDGVWEREWEDAVRQAFPGQDRVDLHFHFCSYDGIFEDVDISPWEAARAFWKLTRSGMGSVFGRDRGIIGDVSNKLKWTAGYVVAWVEDDGFKKKSRKLILDTIAAEKPDVILAHSLGSLITYNALTHGDVQQDEGLRKAVQKLTYVTLGSQIGNPFVVGNLTFGRVEPVGTKRWFHLYNREDDVFTAPIKLPTSDAFEQVDTFFDIEGFADHSAVEYLRHASTRELVWEVLATEKVNPRSLTARAAKAARGAPKRDRGSDRALIVGINEYQNPEDRLEGCVNDAFLMSSVLQECGFPADSIRLCLDQRATAQGILERLEWLLDDPQPNDQRVFYYSGHGATIPEYGEFNEPDRLTETLVPWDFDWSPQTAVIDQQLFQLYAQLPYRTRFAMILDCCHSGGMHRAGQAKARGITPPDDIRHRELKWDSPSQMWVPRDFSRLNPEFSRNKATNEAFFGENGNKVRLGRGAMARQTRESQYRSAMRTSDGPVGPYLPLIIQACGEAELSYEYRHGVHSYGAFTYSFASVLRRVKRISFNDLVTAVRKQLKELQYAQTPIALGPGEILSANVPWAGAG